MRANTLVAGALGAAWGVLGLAPGASGVLLTGKVGVEKKPEVMKINITPIGDPEPGGGQLPPDAIVRILSANIEIHDAIPFGLEVTRGALTPAMAYGLGLPNGYTSPPPNNPAGPWLGLMWPFRDFNDGYATRLPPVTDPPGNSVGVFDSSMAGLGLYFVSEMIGEMSYDPAIPSTYQRGVGGNGAFMDTSFFKIELASIVDVDRVVTVTFRNFRATVLQHDASGRFFTEDVTAEDTTIQFHIPAPATGVMAAMGILALGRRRR